jgi:Ca-activated chloride channel homolog
MARNATYNLDEAIRVTIMKFLAAALIIVVPVLAQAPPVNDTSDLPVIRLDVTRVPLLFTVSDKKGHFVTNLKKDEFDVIENKKSQAILSFQGESELPLRLAVLIDTSNSIRERFKFQQEAATNFIDTAVRRGKDLAMLVSFDTSSEMVADLTDDTEKLNRAIRTLRPGGGTALYDAIYFTAEKLSREQPPEEFRRAMVVLSDGDDNQSRWTRDQALEMAQKADVVIYTISTNSTGLEAPGDKVLKYFADQTGGQTFTPFKVSDLDQSFENIANELRHQYIIVYRPEPFKADGQYHSVDVKVKNRKDLVVRARRGYYAPVALP